MIMVIALPLFSKMVKVVLDDTTIYATKAVTVFSKMESGKIGNANRAQLAAFAIAAALFDSRRVNHFTNIKEFFFDTCSLGNRFYMVNIYDLIVRIKKFCPIDIYDIPISELYDRLLKFADVEENSFLLIVHDMFTQLDTFRNRLLDNGHDCREDLHHNNWGFNEDGDLRVFDPTVINY